jgi:hypothetical protein
MFIHILDFPDGQTLSFDELFEHWACVDEVVIQHGDFDGPHIQTFTMPPAEAQRRFQSQDDPYPLNSLDNQNPNETPTLLRDAIQFSLLQRIREYSLPVKTVGKAARAHYVPNDLSACMTWVITAMLGAYSLPHIDYHGVWTSVAVKDAKFVLGDVAKYWVIWPRLSSEIYWMWAETGELPSYMIPLGMPLRSNSRGVIYPACVHAPGSPGNVLIVGDMFWHPYDIMHILKVSIWETVFKNVTNEDAAKQFFYKMSRIINCRSSYKDIMWNDNDDVEELRRLLRVSLLVLLRYRHV